MDDPNGAVYKLVLHSFAPGGELADRHAVVAVDDVLEGKLRGAGAVEVADPRREPEHREKPCVGQPLAQGVLRIVGRVGDPRDLVGQGPGVGDQIRATIIQFRPHEEQVDDRGDGARGWRRSTSGAVPRAGPTRRPDRTRRGRCRVRPGRRLLGAKGQAEDLLGEHPLEDLEPPHIDVGRGRRLGRDPHGVPEMNSCRGCGPGPQSARPKGPRHGGLHGRPAADS